MSTSSDQLFHCPPPPSMTMDSRWRANIDPAPNCPRCASSNTKFCYYNNYSLSQPRYFCKGCRRYWTKGGSLRSVPVGGGCRKSRRSRSAKALSSSSSAYAGSQNLSPNSSSDGSQESGGPDIDMAAVFAKFLNQDQGEANEFNEGTNTSSEASHDSLTSNSCGMENVFESQKLSDDILDQEFQVLEGRAPAGQKQLQEEDAIQGFINSDLVSFDDIIEDVFWSDDSNISGLTWQPEAQLQEFDSTLLPVDQSSKISTNLFSSENWSYFDNTEFDVFSRP